MNPIVDEVKADYDNRVNFVFVDLSTPDGKARGREEGVMGTPTFVLLDGKGDKVYQIQGVYPRTVLADQLDELLSREQS